jgi:hypothetical protein
MALKPAHKNNRANLMKTLLALFCILISNATFGQTAQDIDRSKVRMRIKVVRFFLDGAQCEAGLLEKNKLGREDLAKSADPFAAKGALGGDPFSGLAPITIIDLAMQPCKVGDTRDVTLYPVEVLNPEKRRYAYTANNALLAVQGKYSQPVTPALVARMAFAAILAKTSTGQITMKQANVIFDSVDDLFDVPITLLGVPSSANVMIYPTAIKGTYALTAADAWKTWQK